jgi:hypothetical protein
MTTAYATAGGRSDLLLILAPCARAAWAVNRPAWGLVLGEEREGQLSARRGGCSGAASAGLR